MPRHMKPRPSGSDVQKTVDLSTSVSVGAWMRAAPSPRSAKSGTKIANAMTMLAIPNSAGTSRCARISSTTSLVTWVMTSAAIFHATPRAAARFRSVGSADSIVHSLWTVSSVSHVADDGATVARVRPMPSRRGRRLHRVCSIALLRTGRDTIRSPCRPRAGDAGGTILGFSASPLSRLWAMLPGRGGCSASAADALLGLIIALVPRPWCRRTR